MPKTPNKKQIFLDVDWSFTGFPHKIILQKMEKNSEIIFLDDLTDELQRGFRCNT